VTAFRAILKRLLDHHDEIADVKKQHQPTLRARKEPCPVAERLH